MSSRDQGMSLAPLSSSRALAHRALLDALLVIWAVHDALHENSRRVDVVRVDLTGFDEMLDFSDRNLSGGRHHRVEVARGLAIDEIAFAVALPGVDDREIGDDAALHNISLAVELAQF